MIKKKILSSILIGLLAFSTGAQSVIASIPLLTESIEENGGRIEESDLSLDEIIEEDFVDSNGGLSNIFINYIDDKLIIFSDKMTSSMTLNIDEEIFNSVVYEEYIELAIPLSDIENPNAVLELIIHNSGEESIEIAAELSTIMRKIDSIISFDKEATQTIENSNINLEQDSAEDNKLEELNDPGNSIEIADNKDSEGPIESIDNKIENNVDSNNKLENSTEETTISDVRVSSSKTTDIIPEHISNGVELSYTTIIGASGFSLDSLPWGTPGYKKIDNTTSLLNQEVVVRQQTRNGEYVLIEHENVLKGWVDRRALREPQIGNLKQSKSTLYSVEISAGQYSVDTLPWGTPGYQRLTRTNSYINQEVNVIRQTNNKEYSLLEDKKGTLLGWVDNRALSPVAEKISDGISVNYQTTVGIGGFTIDTLPWGRKGYLRVDNTLAYENQQINVVQETKNGQYVLIKSNDKLIGWVDRRSLRMPQTGNLNLSSKVYFDAEIIGEKFTIDSLPWGTAGYQRIDSTKNHIGNEVKVVRQTKNGNYFLVEKNDQLLGWIDHRAIKSKYEIGMVKNSIPVDYTTSISKGGYSVDTLPWGVNGFQRIMWSHQYVNKNVNVRYEYGAYALIEQNGLSLGWIDKKALSHVPKLKSNQVGSPVNYSAHLKTGYSIDTLPWGMTGFEKISKTSFYNGEKASVIRHFGGYALVKVGGKLLGWVDRKSLQLPVVFIDPGHGGKDPGAHGWLNGKKILEKDLNLSISLKIRDRLKDEGYKVLMSRENDVSMSRLDRARMANNSDAEIFISIHHNAMPFGYDSVNGIETIFYSPSPSYPTKINKDMHNDPNRLRNSERLAHSVQDSLIASTNAKYRRVFGGAYEVVKEVAMPGIIPEFGFMTNQNELKKITTSSYQELLVRGLVSGVNNYFNN